MARKPAHPPSLPRILVLVGDSPFQIAERTMELRAAIDAAHGEVEVIRFDAAAAPALVLDECRTFGLMPRHKLVIVDDADQFVKESSRPLLERYASAPADSATLLLRAAKWNKGKLDALIEAVGAIEKLADPSPASASAWAVSRARTHHRAALERPAADLLVERLGCELGRIDSELGKLALLADESQGARGAAITRALVAEFVGASREDEVWGLQQVVLGGRPEEALARLREALEIARHSPVLVTFAMMDLARKLYGASRGAREHRNPREITALFKMWGPAAEPTLAGGRALSPASAATLLHRAVECDSRQKSGLGSPARNLEVLAMRFASAIGSSRR